MTRQAVFSAPKARRSPLKSDRADEPERAKGADSPNLGDKVRLGEHGPVAEVVGLGSSGVAILAWREGRRFYEAAFRDFIQRVRARD
jgi:hypothetical protein